MAERCVQREGVALAVVSVVVCLSFSVVVNTEVVSAEQVELAGHSIWGLERDTAYNGNQSTSRVGYSIAVGDDDEKEVIICLFK